MGPMMNIPEDSYKGCGFTPPSKRSNFHLGDDEAALRKLVLSAGFSSMHAWHTKAVLPGVMDADAYLQVMNVGAPSVKSLGASLEQEDKERWIAEMKRRATEVFDRGEAMGCDILMFTAQK